MSSMVLIDSNAQRVIKLSTCRATTELLNQQLAAKANGLPEVIRAFGKVGAADFVFGKQKTRKPVHAFELEFLTEMPSESAKHLSGLVRSARNWVIQNALSGISEPDLSVATIEKFAEESPVNIRLALDLVRMVAKTTGGRFDMQNPDNWMLRGDGSLVMADALFGV